MKTMKEYAVAAYNKAKEVKEKAVALTLGVIATVLTAAGDALATPATPDPVADVTALIDLDGYYDGILAIVGVGLSIALLFIVVRKVKRAMN